MKKPLRLFFILLILVISTNLVAQPQFYTEQNSGVTTNLTSVTMTINSFPLTVWVCGDGGVVLKTTNTGSNWFIKNNGIPSNLNLVTISSRAVDTAVTAGNVGTTTYTYRTANGGTNWTQVFSQSNGHINAVGMINALTGYMVGNPVGGRWSLWKTISGGANWDSTGLYIQQAGTETGFNNSLAIMYNNIWFGTNNSRIYKSSNLGLNWSFVATPQVNTSAVWIYRDTSYNTFAFIGGTNVYSTTNGGINWTLITCPDTASFKGFCPAYYGVGNYPPMGAYSIRASNKIYFYVGQFYSEYTAPSGIYNHMAYDVPIMYWPYTWAVRSNGGITMISLFRGGAVRRITSEVPEDYNLNQNYPNPFNPTTKIRFQVPLSKGGFRGLSSQSVTLKIYDVLGKEIATLVNEQIAPGTYEVEWNGSNYPSGAYFYKLITDTFSETKKMVLIK